MQILSQLNPSGTLSPSLRGELEALERERDPHLAEAGLLNLGRRAERDGDVEMAADLYRLLAGQGQATTAERARQRLGAMTGQESGALRWEYLAGRFTEELLDPASLVAMAAGGLAFRGARLFTLTRIGPGSSWIGPRLASAFASAAGLGAEIPTFVAASNLTREIQGREVDWSVAGLSHDLASTGILLGSLRVAGGTATLLLPLRSRFGIGLGQQAAMFGGILASRYLESAVGLRADDPDAAVAVSESLATLLHFNAAGRIARIAFGPRWAAFERETDLRSQIVQFRIHGDGAAPAWRNHARNLLLAPMWMLMGAGGPGPIGPLGPRLTRGPEGLVRAIRSQIATPESDASLLSRIQSAVRQLPKLEARLIKGYHLNHPAQTMASLDAELGVSRTTTDKIRSRAYERITRHVTQQLAEERGLANSETRLALLDRPVEELGLGREELRLLRRESILYIGEAQGTILLSRPLYGWDYRSYKSASLETARALRGLGLDPNVSDPLWVPPDLPTRGVRSRVTYSSRRQLHLRLDSPADDFLFDPFQRRNWEMQTIFSHQEELSQALQALEIPTTAELLRRDPAELVRGRRLTLLQAQELVRTLGQEGLSFGMDNQGWTPFGTRPLGEARRQGRRALQQALDEGLDAKYLGFRAWHILGEQGIHRLGDVIAKTTQELEGFGLFRRDLQNLDHQLAGAGLQTRMEE